MVGPWKVAELCNAAALAVYSLIFYVLEVWSRCQESRIARDGIMVRARTIGGRRVGASRMGAQGTRGLDPVALWVLIL